MENLATNRLCLHLVSVGKHGISIVSAVLCILIYTLILLRMCKTVISPQNVNTKWASGFPWSTIDKPFAIRHIQLKIASIWKSSISFSGTLNMTITERWAIFQVRVCMAYQNLTSDDKKKKSRYDFTIWSTRAFTRKGSNTFALDNCQQRIVIVIITYGAELIESAEDLYDEVDSLAVDGGVDDVEELRCLPHDVERLDVVWLLPKVVLKKTYEWWQCQVTVYENTNGEPKSFSEPFTPQARLVVSFLTSLTIKCNFCFCVAQRMVYFCLLDFFLF